MHVNGFGRSCRIFLHSDYWYGRSGAHEHAMPTSPDSRMDEINGASIFCETTGEGDVIVLVHSGITDSGTQDPQVSAVAREHIRAITCPFRNTGAPALLPLHAPDDATELAWHPAAQAILGASLLATDYESCSARWSSAVA